MPHITPILSDETRFAQYTERENIRQDSCWLVPLSGDISSIGSNYIYCHIGNGTYGEEHIGIGMR